MPPDLRPFRERDLPRILEIEAYSFPEPWPEIAFTYQIMISPELFLVAEEGGLMVGYVIGEIRKNSERSQRSGHIMNIAVARGFRRRGVGTLLLEGVTERFTEMGASRVTLEVRVSNARAQEFYRERGFTEIGRVEMYYGDEDAIVMMRPIEGREGAGVI